MAIRVRTKLELTRAANEELEKIRQLRERYAESCAQVTRAWERLAEQVRQTNDRLRAVSEELAKVVDDEEGDQTADEDDDTAEEGAREAP